ncbi:AsmA family protein [Limibaculum sp. M0105]|uniref:AsmA family protein n=1 Tax=Thermohalobaculum xanthum TaxID=2753746 RepID=A0A8J7M5S4_9RHOB|nr:AsmA family protein [Thermohalobaculum xanthum]MBK0398643.1 AsmA family protein [Thermohalobaculum xanthum]
MRRLIRFLAYLVAALAAAAAAAVALVVFMPRDQVAAIVSREVERATGRQLVIEGELSPSVWPVLGVSTGPIRLGNAEWAHAPEMVTAAGVEIGVDLASLVAGDIRVERLRLLDPVIALEIAEDGRNNWSFGQGAGGESAGDATGAADAAATSPKGDAERLRMVALPAAEIVNGRVSFSDARTGRVLAVDTLDLGAEFEALDQPVTVKASGVWQGRKAQVDLRLETPQAVMDGREAAVDARIEGELGTVSFTGTVAGLDDPLPRVSGFYELDAPDPGLIMSALGRAPDPALAPLGAVRLDGKATSGDAGLDVSAKGRAVWRARPVLVDLEFSTPEPAADAPRGDLTLSAQSEGIGSLSYAGPVTLGADGPELDGRLEADLAFPGSALSWALGAAQMPELAELGAVSARTHLGLSQSALRIDGDASAVWRGRKIAFDIDAESGAEWSRGGAVKVGLSANAPGMIEARAEGRFTPGKEPSFNGPVKVSTPDLRSLLAWAAGEAPDAPAGTLGPARLAGTVEMGGNRLDIRDLDAGLDSTEARGSVTMALGATPPTLTASLTAGDLDLTPFMGGSGGGGGGAGTGSGGAAPSRTDGWSSEPFDLSGLNGVNATVSIDAASIKAGELRAGRSQLRISLQSGQLNLEIRRLDLYGGGVSGSAAFGGREMARLATDLDISGVDLRPLLSALGVTDRLEGRGALRLQAQGQGRSMAELMRSLGGKGALNLADGAVLGINLAAIAQNLTGRNTAERTDFSSVSGSFTIDKGVLSNSDFAFLGPLLRVTGAGTVDLGAQRQDFILTPKAVASLVGQGGVLGAAGFTIFPVRVTGTWSNPKVAPDLAGAIGRIATSPVGVADGLQEVVTGVSVTELPSEIIRTLTGREPASSGTDAGTGGTAGETKPRGLVGGLLGGLVGALDPRRGKDAEAPQTPATAATAPAEALPPELAADPVPIGGSALAPPAAPLPATKGSPAADIEGAATSSGAAEPEATANGSGPEPVPAQDEPAAEPPRHQSLEEEAVKKLGNILRGFGKN